MNRLKLIICALLIGGTVALDGIGAKTPQGTARANEQSAPRYGIAFASFAPLNTDLFVAEADGRNPRPLLPHPDLDYNGSFSADGRWILFTSTRNGSTSSSYRRAAVTRTRSPLSKSAPATTCVSRVSSTPALFSM